MAVAHWVAEKFTGCPGPDLVHTTGQSILLRRGCTEFVKQEIMVGTGEQKALFKTGVLELFAGVSAKLPSAGSRQCSDGMLLVHDLKASFSPRGSPFTSDPTLLFRSNTFETQYKMGGIYRGCHSWRTWTSTFVLLALQV